jgi:hypothetical protein
VAVAAPSASAATWTAENMAIPQTVQGQLFSLSCSATNACEGVGQTVDARGNTRSLAEAWNGTRWTNQFAPSIAGPLTSLGGVSCSDPTSCMAIGIYQGNASGGSIAEVWDGGSWTVEFVPNPAGATAILNSVSCTTSQSCTAVGYDFNNKTGQQLPLAEVWNGAQWHVQALPAPTGSGISSALNSVSCVGTGCVAVGESFDKNGNPLPLAESRAGSTWQLDALPTPTNAVATLVSSVSCSSAEACTLVGNYLTNTQQLGLAERWNGFAWSQETVPSPAGRPFVALAGVSCPSASACFAVGGAASNTASGPLAESWNGSKWSVQSTPAQPGGFLGSVSCATSTSCNDVGAPGLASSPSVIMQAHPSALPRPGLLAGAPQVSSLGAAAAAKAARAPLASPSVPTNSTFPSSSVAYRPAASVRELENAPAQPAASLTLAEHWNGSAWSIQPTPGFTGAAFTQVIGVGCGSANACFASGFYADNSTGDTLPLVEKYNGTQWTIQPVPAPAGAVVSRVFDVSCTSANACTAVGESFVGLTEVAFADRWNGSTWTLQHVPGLTGLGTALGSVSCTAVAACTAVGATLNDRAGTLAPLAEFWNGSAWAIQPTPSKAGNYSTALYGVSCADMHDCMAAGNFNANGSLAGGALTERFAATTWSLVNLPTPPNASVSLPDPVSCSAVNACTDVGSWFSGTTGGAFSDRWNGTAWARETVPSSFFFFSGVACIATTACLASVDSASAVWNGARWTPVAIAPPLVGNFPSLGAVTCSAATGDCTAVGSSMTGEPIPLAEGFS